MKKILLSIFISILITTSVVTAVLMVNIYNFQFQTFSLVVNGANPEKLSENTVNTLKEIESQVYDIQNQFNEPMYEDFPSETPVIGYNLVFSAFQVAKTITNAYYIAFILGLLIGLFYDLFHNKKYTGKMFLKYTLTAILTIVIIGGIINLIWGNALLNNTDTSFDLTTLLNASSTLFSPSSLLILSLAFIWAYVGNYVSKSIESKRLNQELDVPLNHSGIIKVVVVGIILTIAVFWIMANIGL